MLAGQTANFSCFVTGQNITQTIEYDGSSTSQHKAALTLHVRTSFCQIILLTFKYICHFAEFGERSAVGPGVHDVHHERLELLDVLVLLHRQLGLLTHLRDAPRCVLRINKQECLSELPCSKRERERETDRVCVCAGVLRQRWQHSQRQQRWRQRDSWLAWLEADPHSAMPAAEKILHAILPATISTNLDAERFVLLCQSQRGIITM